MRAFFVSLCLVAQAWAAPIIIYDNLGEPAGGPSSDITGAVWRADRFNNVGPGGVFDISATLLMQQTAPGVAQVDVFSDSGLAPGTLVGSLVSPLVYTSTMGLNSFTGTIALAANTSYGWCCTLSAAPTIGNSQIRTMAPGRALICIMDSVLTRARVGA